MEPNDHPAGMPEPNEPGLSMPAESKTHWPNIAGWNRYLAVIGFLVAAFCGFITVVILNSLIRRSPYMDTAGVLLVAAIYGFFFLLFLFAGILFLRISNSLYRVHRYQHPEDMRRGWRNLLFYYRLAGIATLILIGLQAWLLWHNL